MLISILTIYNNFPEIFTDFRTPEGVDRQTVIDGICADCAELELLYSDPDALRILVKNWTNRHYKIWEELQKTLEYEYNPIWNVEGSETMEITRNENETRNLTDKHNRRDREDRNETETRNLQNRREPDLTTTQNVSAYNSDSYEPREQIRETGNETINNTGSVTNQSNTVQAGEETINHTGSVTGNGAEKRVFTRGMNLGVTTTQQLIREQREIVQFTVANYIITSFKDNFCLLVY